MWQFGTNSVIHDHKIGDHDTSIRDGLKKIRSIGADVVLIDPQFSPKVIMKAGIASTIELIATTAKDEDVDLFPRFNVMKHWRSGNRKGSSGRAVALFDALRYHGPPAGVARPGGRRAF